MEFMLFPKQAQGMDLEIKDFLYGEKRFIQEARKGNVW